MDIIMLGINGHRVNGHVQGVNGHRQGVSGHMQGVNT